MAERGRPRGFDRDAALASAMRLFWDKGYEATSIVDLTAAMGVGSPSLYAAFGSKEALFLAAVELFEATEGARLTAAVAAAPTARGAIEAFLFESADGFTAGDRPRGCMMTLTAVNAVGASDGACAALRVRRAGAVAALVERLERGRAAGEIATGVDLKALAAFYVTLQQGMSIQARDGASRSALRAVARNAMAGWDALTAAAQ